MNRLEKQDNVEKLKQKFQKANAAFVTEYRGMSVQSMWTLRTKISQNKGELKVLKNRLAKIAIKGSKFEALGENLTGPIALALSFEDPVAIAKALSESIQEESPFRIRLGNLNGKLLKEADVKALSKLPDSKTLLAMLVGTLQAPLSNFVGVVAALPRNLVNVLSAVKTQKEKT